jgi:hypothetical protein
MLGLDYHFKKIRVQYDVFWVFYLSFSEIGHKKLDFDPRFFAYFRID